MDNTHPTTSPASLRGEYAFAWLATLAGLPIERSPAWLLRAPSFNEVSAFRGFDVASCVTSRAVDAMRWPTRDACREFCRAWRGVILLEPERVCVSRLAPAQPVDLFTVHRSHPEPITDAPRWEVRCGTFRVSTFSDARTAEAHCRALNATAIRWAGREVASA